MSSPARSPRGISSRVSGTVRSGSSRSPRLSRWLTTAAIAVAIATVAITIQSGSGTLALWSDEADIPEATIEVGGMNLAIAANSQTAPEGQTTAAIAPQTLATMLPGDVIGTPITLTNTGASPVRVSAELDSATAGQSDATFWLSQGACPASGTAGTKVTGKQATLAGAPLSSSAVYCLQVALSATIPAARQGTLIVPSFTLTLTGVPERTS